MRIEKKGLLGMVTLLVVSPLISLSVLGYGLLNDDYKENIKLRAKSEYKQLIEFKKSTNEYFGINKNLGINKYKTNEEQEELLYLEIYEDGSYLQIVTYKVKNKEEKIENIKNRILKCELKKLSGIDCLTS